MPRTRPVDNIIDLDAPGLAVDDTASPTIAGDLTDSQLAALRHGLSSESQMKTAQEVVRLLVTQQETFVRDLGANSTSAQTPGNPDDALMAKLGIAEANAKLAAYGQSTIDTVEGKIKALEFVTRQVIELGSLEPKTKLQAERLITEYRKLLVTQGFELRAAQLQGQNTILELEAEHLTVGHKFALQSEGAIEALKLDSKAAKAERRAKSIAIERKEIDTDAEERRLRRERALADRRKANADWREFGKLRRERYGPATKRAAWGLAVLILLSNLIADDPSHASAPLFGVVNRAWDSLYIPVSNGVGRTFHNLTSDPAPPATPKKSAPVKKVVTKPVVKKTAK